MNLEADSCSPTIFERESTTQERAWFEKTTILFVSELENEFKAIDNDSKKPGFESEETTFDGSPNT